jgi:hypothetical protein
MQRRSAGWIRRSTLHPPWNECHRLPPLYYTPIISTIVLLEEAERKLGRSHDREAHGRPPKGRHFACMVSVSRPPHGWIHLGKVTSRASCIRGRRWLRLHRHGAVSFSAILRPKPGPWETRALIFHATKNAVSCTCPNYTCRSTAHFVAIVNSSELIKHNKKEQVCCYIVIQIQQY